MLFNRKRDKRDRKRVFSDEPVQAQMESLENRWLMSASIHQANAADLNFARHGQVASTIPFNQAPVAVQTGLDNLATKDGVTAPTSTQTVFLGNAQGVETYTVDITGTGTDTRLTVDQNGNPLTAPTRSTATWGTLSGTGAGSNAAAAKEISAIAAALSLAAPTSATNVNVSTTAAGVTTYTVRLSTSSSATDWHSRNVTISVDASGNPVGNQNIPFSAIPTVIQNGLNTNRPSGAAALASSSTQNVAVRTLDGLTTYSTTFTSSGTTTTVSVNSSGQLAKLPSHTTAQFSTIPSAAQKELQTLATADGVSATIGSTQTIQVYDEANGTTIYSVTLPASKTASSGNSYTYNLTIAVDQSGNPTTPPSFGEEFEGGFGFGGFEYGGAGFFGRRR